MNIRETREHLFKILFESDANSILPIEIAGKYINREDNILDNEQKEFIEKYSSGISENIEYIDKIIDENMKGWTLSRIGIVDRVLLRFSTYEILYDLIPYNISINEVIEIAKIYGEDKSYEFINGVLANVVKFKNTLI